MGLEKDTMKRIVVTGIGIVSSLGNDQDTVLTALQEGRSGIRFNDAYKELGLRSQVSGSVEIDLKSRIDRKVRRFMGGGAAYSYLAMEEAIADAALPEELVSHPRTGLIAGSGGTSSSNQVEAADILRAKGIRRVSPFVVPRIMGNTVSACLATAFGIKGVNYSISSACATSAHCIGAGLEQILLNKQDIVFAGGGEEERWEGTMGFDAMGALSSKYNDRPQKASRPYDVARDGFVVAGGGGIVVLEELNHAKERGARIYAEITGYGSTSDGNDMVAPSGEGAVRCMHQALETAHKPIGYINTHGTSTPVGDLVELRSISEVFGRQTPRLSSTKSLSGHALGASGVHEAIYCLLMLKHDFIAASANIDTLEEEAKPMPIVQERENNAGLDAVMSNSFGFGGTNASLVFERLNGEAVTAA